MTPGTWKMLSILGWRVLRLGIPLHQDLPRKRTQWRPEERGRELVKKAVWAKDSVPHKNTVEDNQEKLKKLESLSSEALERAWTLRSSWDHVIHSCEKSSSGRDHELCLLLFTFILQSMKSCSLWPQAQDARETGKLAIAITMSSPARSGPRMKESYHLFLSLFLFSWVL